MKYIHFDENKNIFTLKTKNSEYQMKIDSHNVLLHTYYGDNVDGEDISYNIIKRDVSFSGNPYESMTDRTFSLDVLPQEFSGAGNGDYRVNSIECMHSDSSNIIDLRYKNHKIINGKYRLSSMPSMYDDGNTAETLIIDLVDSSNLVVSLYYSVFYEYDIICRSAKVQNCSHENINLIKVMSMMLDFNYKDFDLIHFHGRHAMERIKERQNLNHGIFTIESKRGMSSHHHNPFVILCDKTTDEDKGDCYGFAFVYSGNFICDIQKDQMDSVRIAMGIHPYNFSYALKPSETFECPETVICYSNKGLSNLSNKYHDAIRNNLIRSKYVSLQRPILVNNWEATYFNFNSKKILEIANCAKEIGLDLMVLDDGWFGKRDDDNSGLGDWYTNETKIDGGLKSLADKIHNIGMKFGLWIEPEMISEDSDLFRTHPEWVLRIPGRAYTRSRNQLNLNITIKAARDHVMNNICSIIKECNIDYIKFDMNRALANVYAIDRCKEQGRLYHDYVLALYEMQERIVSEFPNILLENCAGGGGRFDLGMLYYSPQIWCSDNTDALNRLIIHYGTSFLYPVSSIGSHVSVVPNHQTGELSHFEQRAISAFHGTFGFELDITKMSDEEKLQAKKYIKLYKSIENLIQNGDYFRLKNPIKENSFAWQFVSKNKKESIVCVVLAKKDANAPIYHIKLKGLDENNYYIDENTSKIYKGKSLLNAGLALKDSDFNKNTYFLRLKITE